MDIQISKLIDKKIKILKKDLNNIGKNQVKNAVETTMKKSIKESIYDKPSSYDRTWFFYDSVDSNVTTNNDGASISVFTNPEKMNNSHYSVAGSKRYGLNPNDNVDEYISEWLAYGHGGLWDYSPLHNYIEFTYRLLQTNKTHVKATKKALKEYGYNVK